jgi:4-hydroxy-tetrahydrodipicolinate reductase
MTKIIVHGYRGRMGQTICALAAADPECEVVAGVDKNIGPAGQFPSFNDIAFCDAQADVIIDFSNASAVPGVISYAAEKKIAVVVATTGLEIETERRLTHISKSVPVFRSANMSLGINLIASLLSKISPVLYNENFDIEIIERHHNIKADAPSGTAYLLANEINNSLADKLEYVTDRSQTRGPRNKKQLGICAVRGGTIVGEHEILFAGRDETIKIIHGAYSKDVFAVGALSAGKFLAKQPAGFYDMRDLIKNIL